MLTSTVTVEELIEVIQEGLVDAEARARMDDLEREAFAHDIATRHLTGRARRAVELGQPPMDPATETELISKAIAGYFGSGKFQVLLDLPDVTDIMINSPAHIWVQHSDGRSEQYPHRVFVDDDDIRSEVARLARRAGGTERRFDDGKPLLVLRLPDGSRLAATMVVAPHTQVAIRRNVLPAASLRQLADLGTIDGAMRSIFAAAMRARMRIVISGETGAGKSTFARALIDVLPPSTRMVVIEDTRELNIASDPARAGCVLEWETREANIEGVGEITQSDLVRQALRFNPEWLIVGEVRDAGAAREMLLAMQHGHPSLSTVHHHSAQTAWRKLAQYITQGSESMGFEIAALVISDAVDFFVHLARDRTGRRVVSEVCETAGWNGTEVQLNRIFVAGDDGRGVAQAHLSDARRRRLVEHGFDDQLLIDADGWWRS